MKPHIELVSTGSELLSGRTVNRHAAVLGEHLQRLGLELDRDMTVPDHLEWIAEAVSSALKRADVVMVSGGLGPTCDDITRDALAKLLGRRVVTDPVALESLRKRMRQMGRTVTPQAELQARIVEGGTALQNSLGAAPGERIELENQKVIFVLPGPPDEFLCELTEHVLPWLQAHFPSDAAVREKMFLVCGLGESAIVALFEEAGVSCAGMHVAYSAKPGRIEIRLRASEISADEFERQVQKIRTVLGENVFAEERVTMEDVVGRLLKAGGKTLATAESCTGGLLGGRITAVSGSSGYYLGGVVAYSNEVKTRILGVDAGLIEREGAVSEAVAREMAKGVRKMLGTDIGVAVTGIAGPAGGTPEKPVGLVYIAVADSEGEWVKENRFARDRERVREWSVQYALDMVRRLIRKDGG